MLKNLKKYLESEKKDKQIFDIVIYGSVAKGEESARDIDVLVIFLEGTLRERLDKLQKIKTRLKNIVKNLDIKQILLKELFSTSFLARSGIFLGGISVFKHKQFAETMGFNAFTLFWYHLKNLNHTQKVKFNYILAGRNSQGIIKELDGERLVNGAIKMPIEKTIVFEKILIANNVDYSKKNILEEI